MTGARIDELRCVSLSRVVLAVLAVGCVKNRPSEEDLQLAAALERADQAWRSRGVGGLAPVAAALEEVPPSRRSVAEVRWRWVRFHVAEGLTAADRAEALRAFAAGRDEGVACLRDDPAVRTTAARAGWVSAAPLVQVAQAPCAAWAGLAWSRWVVEFGAVAAAVDADAMGALTARALSDEDPEVHDVAAWAEGLRAVRLGLTDSDRRRGVALLVDTARRGESKDDAWVRWWDVVREVAAEDRRGVGEPARPPSNSEERVAAVRSAGR